MDSLLLDMPIMAGRRKGDVLTMPCGPNSTFGDVHMFLKGKLGHDNLSVFLRERGTMHFDCENLLSKTLREFMCVAYRIPVYVHDGFLIPIFVKTLKGKTLKVHVCKTHDIWHLKNLIKKKEGTSIDKQRLIYAGKQLEDGRSICDYDICEEATVHMVIRLRGGGVSLQKFPLVDVSNDDARIDRAWSSTAPAWRIANKGLVIEGICVNRMCNAFRRHVTCNMGFGCFNMETAVPSCPLCHTTVDSENIGFNNCFYRILGVKADSCISISLPWTKVGDFYRTWDMLKAGIVDWEHMEIVVRSLQNAKVVPGKVCKEAPVAEECAICFSRMGHGHNFDMLHCCHSFHSKCWEEWSNMSLSKGCDVACPLCGSTVQSL